MLVTKCDICKKELRKSEKGVSVGYDSFLPRYSFCSRCGKPIILFLQKHRLAEKGENQNRHRKSVKS